MLGDSFEDIEFSPYKYLNHIDKIRNLAHDKDVFPVTVELDLVDFCNHNCWWCVDPAHSNNSLERSFVSKLLIELKSLGVKGVVFKGGGEPTLHQQFADILNEAKELGFEIGIVTNGSQLAKLHKSIVSAASYVRVSIDGPTSESHNKLHRSNDFSKIMDGVSQIMILRKKNKQRHPIVGLSFAMDYAMIHLVKEAIALGDISGVDYVFFRPPFFEEAGRKSSMTVEQKKKLITEFERQKQAYTGEMRILIDYWISDFDAKKIS